MAVNWHIKSEVMRGILLNRQVDKLKEELNQRFRQEEVIETLFNEAGFNSPEKRQEFRRELDQFFRQEIGIGLFVSLNRELVPDEEVALESIRRHLDNYAEIARKWNEVHDKGWHLPYRLIVWFLRREIRRLEAREKASTLEGSREKKLLQQKLSDSAAESKAVQEQLLSNEPDGEDSLFDGSVVPEQSFHDSREENTANDPEPPITCVQESVKNVAGPEESLLERGRVWLKELHLALGVADPAELMIARLQQQVQEMEKKIATYEQECISLKEQLAANAELDKEVKSRWSHLETLEKENRRLEKELVQSRTEAIGDLFQDMIEKNAYMEEVLLGRCTDMDIRLAGLVEYFRRLGLRPYLPAARLGEKVRVNYRNNDFRPLDFSFTGDGEVEAVISHPGISFGQRILVLPGLQLASSVEKSLEEEGNKDRTDD